MDYKKQSMKNWGKAPCGSNTSHKKIDTGAYFEEITQYRYRTHPWLKKLISKYAKKDKKYLEVGFGMGTDLVEAAKKNAKVWGIDITPKNKEIAQKRLKFYNRKANLIIADCENLPFQDDYFDIIYSMGVIHHTPNTQKAINEMHRVLKPKGKAVVMVYHKNSFFYWWTLFTINWILKMDFLREPFKHRLARIEYPGDNPNLLVKTYKKDQIKAKFWKFSRVKTSIKHLQPEDISLFGQFLSHRTLNKLSQKYGWYVVIEAEK